MEVEVQQEAMEVDPPPNWKEIEQLQYENLQNKLRLSHLNEEEKRGLKHQCLQYKDTFYCHFVDIIIKIEEHST